jgi:hypothetical protein
MPSLPKVSKPSNFSVYVYEETVLCVIDDGSGHEPERIGSGEFATWGYRLAGRENVHDSEGASDNKREKPMA